MSLLIDTTSCLLCVLMSVCANVFANEIGSEPVICECKQIDTRTNTHTFAHRIDVGGNPMGKILRDEALLRATTQFTSLFPFVGNQTSFLWMEKELWVWVHECRFLGGMSVLVKCGVGNLFQLLNGVQTMVLAHTHTFTHSHIICLDMFKCLVCRQMEIFTETCRCGWINVQAH